jgi:hypothetical protein
MHTINASSLLRFAMQANDCVVYLALMSMYYHNEQAPLNEILAARITTTETDNIRNAHSIQKRAPNQFSHALTHFLMHLSAAIAIGMLLTTIVDLDGLLRRLRNFHSY